MSFILFSSLGPRLQTSSKLSYISVIVLRIPGHALRVLPSDIKDCSAISTTNVQKGPKETDFPFIQTSLRFEVLQRRCGSSFWLQRRVDL